MINPALFIGLGTTGKEILEYLQELMMEHYGRYSLPIFKFVVFETHKGTTPKVKEVQIEYLTIENTRFIKDHISEREYLIDWLDINLLDISGSRFDAGASNIRMAGRLCLWHKENWDKVREVFWGKGGEDKGVNEIKVKIEEAEDLLRDYYDKIGKQFDRTKPLISNTPTVYIVGTLYGGTCSGMFIDIAYLAKYVFGLWAYQLPDPNLAPVRGIFTICDSTEIQRASGIQSKRRAANCWAALKELDYWYHPMSTYEIRFPGGEEIKTNEPPIDGLYLISYSGPKAGAPLVADFETLKHKAALNLFTEVVGDLLASKKEIDTDFRGAIDLSSPDKNQGMRFINTFGIAAYWFPKYCISQAAACLYGAEEICGKWLGTTEIHATRIGQLKTEAEGFCKKIIEDNKGELTTTAEGNLESWINNFFADRRELMVKSVIELEQALRDEINTLSERGKYDEEIGKISRKNSFRTKLFDAIDEEIRQRIDKIGDGTYTIDEILNYLANIDNAIKDVISQCQGSYPNLDLEKASLSEISLRPDGWVKAVRQEKKLKEQEMELINREKERVLRDCREYMLATLKNIVDYRMREPLEKLRGQLGVEIQLPDDLRRAGERSIKQSLEAIREAVKECKEHFSQKAAGLKNVTDTTEDIKIVTKGPSLEEDISDLLATLKTNPAVKEDMMTEIRKRPDGTQKPMREFLQYGIRDISSKTIYEPIFDSLAGIALEKIQGFDIAKKVLGTYDLPNIRLFAKQSQPHLELAGDLPSKNLGQPPELIVGKSEALQQLEEKLNDPHSQDRIGFSRVKATDEIDHMLIFYKQESYLFKDTHLSTAVTGLYPRVCHEIEERAKRKGAKKKEEGDVPYSVFTHKEGERIFDPNVEIRKEEARKLIDIAKDIFSIRDDHGKFIESQIFMSVGDTLKHEFPHRGVPDSIRGDEEGVKKMGLHKDVYDYFEDLINRKVKEIGKEGFKEGIEIEDASGEKKKKYGLSNYLKWRDQYERNEGLSEDGIDKRLDEEREKYFEILSNYFPEGE